MSDPTVSSRGRYFIGYDLGTSGLKTALINSKGVLVASAFCAYSSFSPRGGYHEQKPEDWWDALVKTTRKVMRDSKVPRSNVSGISFGVQAFGTIPVTKECRSLLPCMTWADTRSTIEANCINEKTGMSISPKDFPAKALWVMKNEPGAFTKAHKLVDCNGYLIAKFTGNFLCAEDIALGIGFDPEKKKWLLESFGISADKLPEPADITSVVGETTGKAAKETGLRPGVPVYAGGTDFTTGVIGSGAIRPGRAHVYLGTGSWIAVISRSLPTRAPLRQYESSIFSFNFLNRWITGGESDNACACLNWFKNELAPDLDQKAKRSRITPYQMLDRMAEDVEPGSGNLIFVPWMKGERAPVKDDFARGAFIGLTLAHRRKHLVRAVMEGVALNMTWVLEQILGGQKTEFEFESLRAIGGGFKSRLWAQIFADATGRRIEALKWPEYAGAIGAALICAVGTGEYKSLDDLDGLVPPAFLATSRTEYRDKYDRLLASYKRLYPEEVAKIYRQWGNSQT